MKYFLIIVLLPISLWEEEQKSSLGSWEKHSFDEYSLEIDQSFKQAANQYCKSHDVEIDDLIPLTVYSQLVNGKNFNIIFIDSKSEYPSIEEYMINKGFNNKPGDYTVKENHHYENTVVVIPFNDPSFTLLENKLYQFLKDTTEELSFISYAYPLENKFTIFYIISAHTKDGEHQYAVCHDKITNEFDNCKKIK